MKRSSRSTGGTSIRAGKVIPPRNTPYDVYIEGQWYTPMSPVPSITPSITPTVTPSITPSVPPIPFGETVLMLHFNESPLLDSSVYQHTVTNTGGVNSGTNSLFGNNQYFGGNSGFNVNVQNSSVFNFGSGDFTIEGWVHPLGYDTRNPQYLFSRDDGTSIMYIRIAPRVVEFFDNQLGTIVGSLSVDGDVWNHIAVTRSGTSVRLFVNGQLSGSLTTSASITDCSSAIRFAGAIAGGAVSLGGRIEDWRIIKDYAAYTAPFSVPVSELPNVFPIPPSVTPSVTPTLTTTPSVTPSITPSETPSASFGWSPSVSITPTPTVTPSISYGWTPSAPTPEYWWKANSGLSTNAWVASAGGVDFSLSNMTSADGTNGAIFNGTSSIGTSGALASAISAKHILIRFDSFTSGSMLGSSHYGIHAVLFTPDGANYYCTEGNAEGTDYTYASQLFTLDEQELGVLGTRIAWLDFVNNATKIDHYPDVGNSPTGIFVPYAGTFDNQMEWPAGATMILGDRGEGGNFLAGAIKEIAIFTTSQSASDIKAFRAEMNSRWP